MSPTTPTNGVLLTTADVRQWEEELRGLDRQIQQIRSRQDHLHKMLGAASLFLNMDSRPEPAPEPEQVEPAKSVEVVGGIGEGGEAPTGAGNGVERHFTLETHRDGTWRHLVLTIVTEAEMGMTYAEVRQAVMASSFGPKLRVSDKGYHNAISRLVGDGTLIRQYGRLFTPKALTLFQQAADAGEVSTSVPQPFVYSPMGEAILKAVSEKPGLIGKEVIAELRKDPEFNAALTPHETGAFNIIARLVKRSQIVRRDDGGLVPGPSFPRDRFPLADAKESATDTNEVTAA